MIESGHFGATEIRKKIGQLEDKWEAINEHAQTRQRCLADAHQAQQYFSEAQEAESWMKEKEPMVAGRDYGKDEDSAQVLKSVCNFPSISSTDYSAIYCSYAVAMASFRSCDSAANKYIKCVM